MWICPVCKKQNSEGLLCVGCGFDESLHYKKYRTLSNVDVNQEAVVRLYQTGQASELINMFQNPEKLEKFICLAYQAQSGVSEAWRGLGEFYKKEFSGQNMKKRGDYWLQKAAKKNDQVLEKGLTVESLANTEKKVSERTKISGRVIAIGDNQRGQCEISQWNNIVEIVAGMNCTVGVRGDGSVAVVGGDESWRRLVSEWTDIKAISEGGFHIVGVKADGRVVAAGSNGSNQCGVSNWRNIIDISAGRLHTVGLERSGGVIAVGGDKFNNQYRVFNWENILAISAGGFHTVGLRRDGRVVAVGDGGNGQSDV